MEKTLLIKQIINTILIPLLKKKNIVIIPKLLKTYKKLTAFLHQNDVKAGELLSALNLLSQLFISDDLLITYQNLLSQFPPSLDGEIIVDKAQLNNLLSPLLNNIKQNNSYKISLLLSEYLSSQAGGDLDHFSKNGIIKLLNKISPLIYPNEIPPAEEDPNYKSQFARDVLAVDGCSKILDDIQQKTNDIAHIIKLSFLSKQEAISSDAPFQKEINAFKHEVDEAIQEKINALKTAGHIDFDEFWNTFKPSSRPFSTRLKSKALDSEKALSYLTKNPEHAEDNAQRFKYILNMSLSIIIQKIDDAIQQKYPNKVDKKKKITIINPTYIKLTTIINSISDDLLSDKALKDYQSSGAFFSQAFCTAFKKHLKNYKEDDQIPRFIINHIQTSLGTLAVQTVAQENNLCTTEEKTFLINTMKQLFPSIESHAEVKRKKSSEEKVKKSSKGKVKKTVSSDIIIKKNPMYIDLGSLPSVDSPVSSSSSSSSGLLTRSAPIEQTSPKALPVTTNNESSDDIPQNTSSSDPSHDNTKRSLFDRYANITPTSARATLQSTPAPNSDLDLMSQNKFDDKLNSPDNENKFNSSNNITFNHDSPPLAPQGMRNIEDLNNEFADSSLPLLSDFELHSDSENSPLPSPDIKLLHRQQVEKIEPHVVPSLSFDNLKNISDEKQSPDSSSAKKRRSPDVKKTDGKKYGSPKIQPRKSHKTNLTSPRQEQNGTTSTHDTSVTPRDKESQTSSSSKSDVTISDSHQYEALISPRHRSKEKVSTSEFSLFNHLKRRGSHSTGTQDDSTIDPRGNANFKRVIAELKTSNYSQSTVDKSDVLSSDNPPSVQTSNSDDEFISVTKAKRARSYSLVHGHGITSPSSPRLLKPVGSPRVTSSVTPDLPNFTPFKKP
jgi:hypothetical protein